MKKFISRIMLVAMLISQLAYIPVTNAASPGDIIISEFFTNPASGDEWYELLNTTGSDINLSTFSFQRLEPAEETPLSGTIPAHGIVTISKPSNVQNDAGDFLALMEGGTDISIVSYGTYGPIEGEPHTNAPAIGESGIIADYNQPLVYTISTTPTRGWFNNAVDFTCPEGVLTDPGLSAPPTLSSISNCLLAAPTTIYNNLTVLSDPSNATGIYFEKLVSGSTLGSINFIGPLNLTDNSTITALKEFGSKMEASKPDGEVNVGLNTSTPSAFSNTSAVIKMYQVPDTGVTPKIIVKDNSGVLIDPESPTYPNLTLGTYDNIAHTLDFTTSHFTSFETDTLSDAEAVAADKANLIYSLIQGSNVDLSNITAPLNNPLPPIGGNNSTITWSSNAPSIISNDGQTIVRPAFGESNATVELTATITKGVVSDTKVFTLTVLAETTSPDDASKVAADKAALTDDIIKGTNPDLLHITTNLTNPLPSLGTNGSTITWTSGDTFIISDDGQTVTRPLFSENDSPVILTATITNGTATDTKDFSLIILRAPASSIATISSSTYTVSSVGGGNETITNVPVGTSKVTFTANITQDDPYQTLDVSGLSDPITDGDTVIVTAEDNLTAITYTITTVVDTTSPVISETTPVTTPTTDNTPDYAFTSDEAGTITYGGDCSSTTTAATVGLNTITFNTLADATYSNCTIKVTDAALNESNTINVSSFTVNAILTPDEEKVAADKAALVEDSIKGANPDLGNITLPLTNPLPSLGANGSTITWAADWELISNDGQTINRPAYSTGDSTANFIATITFGTATDTKVFPIIVLKAPASTIATVTSSTYSISTLGGGSETITNVPTGTSKATFLANLNKSHPYQQWTDTNISDPVTDGNTLVSTAEDGLTSITYTITTVVDATSPVISETTPVTTPTNDSTPDYAFTSDEAGTITYGGDCSSATTSASAGLNTITFNTLADATYSNCTIKVTDGALNESNTINVSSFTVDTSSSSDADKVAADKAALVEDSIKGANPDLGNITLPLTNPLPSLGANGSTITWAADWELISNDGQTINRPAYSTGDSTANFIATITFGTATDTKVFPIIVLKAPASTIATVTSSTYSISTLGGGSETITNVPTGTSKATFLANLNKSHPYQQWTDTNISDPVTDGNTLVSTAEDGLTSITYTITTATDTTSPVISETTPVTTPSKDTTPNYSFTTDEAGTITYGGDCSSATTAATVGLNTVTFNTLTEGTHNNCTLKVTDSSTNESNTLNVTAFTIDLTAPTVTKLGDDSADVTIAAAATATLTFSEALNTASKTAAENALTLGADKTITYSWNPANDTLTINGNATEVTTFQNDVTATVSDTSGNQTTDLLLIDSKLETNQIDPSGGTATMTQSQDQVVINDSQPTTVTVPNTVTTGTLNVDSLINGGTGTLPAITVNATTSVGAVAIELPADTTVTGPAGWDGTINLPQVKSNSSVTPTPDSGYTASVSEVIEIGYNDTALTFDKGIRIRLAGQAGKLAGYSRSGVFTKISTTCTADTQVAADALPAGGDCKIDVGSDLVIWTKHFTNFLTYSQTAISSGGSSGGGGGGGSSYVSVATPSTSNNTTQQTGTQETTQTSTQSFNDILNHWAHNYIETAKEKQYINGYSDGSFKPDQAITRAEVAKVIALWKNAQIESTECTTSKFTDISCSEWYAKSVNYLSQENIINGYNDGTFRPNNPITRAEALKITIYAKNLQNTDTQGYNNTFKDIQESDWYINIVLIAAKLGIVNGYGDGTFRPNNPISRAEFTKIFVETMLNR